MSAGSPLKHLSKQADNIPRSDGDAGGSSPPHMWGSSSEEKNTSPKETLSSVIEYENVQPGCLSPNNAPNCSPPRDPWETSQPLEFAFSLQSTNQASHELPLQQSRGKESANPPKPEARDQLEREPEHQTEASFLETSGATPAEGAYLLSPKMNDFASPLKKPQMAFTNPNAFFKLACDSIATLRTTFDHFINDKMEALGKLAPALLWMDARSSPEALEATEIVQATAASCDYIVKFLNWSPTRLSMERCPWRPRPSGAGRARGSRLSRQRKGKFLKPEKFSQRAILKFLSAKLGKSGPKRKRVALKASKYNRKA
ncbi:uncharacterized protein LOC143834099 isoform X2 [Paroedura picta]|uniref:uncharacterized protein LOC143834099 isoform X2 n=1 Tax=Paroedura picta TaxID=143630 RepID=UPI00405619C3